jgi:AraC family transcriptional regulator, positive regulator of tynA and feaB
MAALHAASASPAAPGLERWSVHRPTSRRGVARDWADILASTHVALDVQFTHRTPSRFRGTVIRRRFGELTVVDCMCLPFCGHYAATTGEPGEASIGFQTVLRGAELVRYGAAEQTIAHGEAVLWDGAHPVDVEVVEPFMKRTLIFPRERVLSVCPRLGDVHALESLGRPAARLLARYVDALTEELPDLAGDHAAMTTATDVALELLRSAVDAGLPSDRAAAREALRAQVRRYVRVHLADPRLSPESIARAHSMSLRSLYTLFEDTGESVAAFVRRSRLARCRADLERPDGGTVTEIAFRWGFTDAAHFSTVFKRHFGVTPREVRGAARISK